jgi:hypothetical protein
MQTAKSVKRLYNLNMEKAERKQKTPSPRSAPIDFISSLQLEECQQRLWGFKRKEIKIRTDEPEADSSSFTVEWFRDKHMVAYGKGTLRRWQGTSTRVEIETQPISNVAVHPLADKIMLWVSIVALVMMVFAPLIVFFFVRDAQTCAAWGIGFMLIGPTVFGLVRAELQWISHRYEQREMKLLLIDLLSDNQKINS